MAGDLTAAWLPRRERVRLPTVHLFGQDGSLVRMAQRLSKHPRRISLAAAPTCRWPGPRWPQPESCGSLGPMGGHTRACPRCGAHFELPLGQRPVMGIMRTAESPAAGSRTVSLRVDDVLHCGGRAERALWGRA